MAYQQQDEKTEKKGVIRRIISLPFVAAGALSIAFSHMAGVVRPRCVCVPWQDNITGRQLPML